MDVTEDLHAPDRLHPSKLRIGCPADAPFDGELRRQVGVVAQCLAQLGLTDFRIVDGDVPEVCVEPLDGGRYAWCRLRIGIDEVGPAWRIVKELPRKRTDLGDRLCGVYEAPGLVEPGDHVSVPKQDAA